MTPTILFRCNASSAIGSGHVMRCLTLAAELHRGGSRIVFMTNAGGEAVIRNFAAVPVAIVPENSSVLQLRDSGWADYMVWDSYDMNELELRELSRILPIMALDDTYLLPRYDCDAVLNQNMGADASRYRHDAGRTTVLAGCRYSMLRDEFRGYAGELKSIAPVATRILLTFGGADSANNSLRFLEWFEVIRNAAFRIDVVVGTHYAQFESLQEYAARYSFHEVTVHRNVRNMAELLWQQDLVISAGGSTLYELAVLGIPICGTLTADNQIRLLDAFADQGICVHLGWAQSLLRQEFADKLEAIVHSPDRRQKMSAQSRMLVDGAGVARVADYIRSRCTGT